jgi:hypothetical protein
LTSHQMRYSYSDVLKLCSVPFGAYTLEHPSGRYHYFVGPSVELVGTLVCPLVSVCTRGPSYVTVTRRSLRNGSYVPLTAVH